MAQFQNWVCTRCNVVKTGSVWAWPGQRRVYALSLAEMVPVTSRLEWCASCDDVCLVEVIPSEDVISERIASLRIGLTAAAKDESPYSLSLAAYISDVLRAEMKWRQWARENRERYPRCLNCGTEYVGPPSSEDKLPHAGCGGVLVPEDSDVHMQFKNVERIELVCYSPEGLLLRR